jgi:transcriptional regulator with XRE-family HTH domain
MGTNRENKPEVKDDDRKAMGDRLREAREYLGFSQEEVATYLGVSRSALSLIETGQRKVDALELKKLASLYKRPATYFTGEDAENLAVGEEIAHLARKASELSAEDRAELGRFADFLRAKKQNKGG